MANVAREVEALLAATLAWVDDKLELAVRLNVHPKLMGSAFVDAETLRELLRDLRAGRWAPPTPEGLARLEALEQYYAWNGALSDVPMLRMVQEPCQKVCTAVNIASKWRCPTAEIPPFQGAFRRTLEECRVAVANETWITRPPSHQPFFVGGEHERMHFMSTLQAYGDALMWLVAGRSPALHNFQRRDGDHAIAWRIHGFLIPSAYGMSLLDFYNERLNDWKPGLESPWAINCVSSFVNRIIAIREVLFANVWCEAELAGVRVAVRREGVHHAWRWFHTLPDPHPDDFEEETRLRLEWEALTL
jgi:hypothetical protein